MALRRIAVVAFIISLSSLVPNAALPVSYPLLDELHASGTHWVAWRVGVTEPAMVSYETQVLGGPETRQAAFASWMIGDNGASFTIVGLANPDNGGSHVHSIATGVLLEEPGSLMPVDHGVAVIHRLPAGTYTIVHAWDGADTGFARLSGQAGVAVLGRSDGDDAAWSPQREFDGVLNADLAGSGATIAGTVGREISSTLFGAFLKFPGVGVEVLAYTGPVAGIAADAVITVDSRGPTASALNHPFFIFNGAPPGSYRFSDLAGYHEAGGITLITADVRLP